jgi:hypothetical protein
MKIAALVILIVCIGFVSEWTYRTFFRPIVPLEPVVNQMVAFFKANGIEVRPYAVRSMFPYSEVSSVAALEIKGYPLPISLIICPNEEAALKQLASAKLNQNLLHPTKNGLVVMNLPMWGEGTEEMASRVVSVFSQFK